ncbi:unnamed protein product, partial [Closterium sp. NIES-64]
MRVRISRMDGAQGPGKPGGAGEASSQSDADAWRELLRGGEDVAQVMSDMANILDDISGLEGREEELAVQMAAAAAIAGRVSTLDQSFLVQACPAFDSSIVSLSPALCHSLSAGRDIRPGGAGGRASSADGGMNRLDKISGLEGWEEELAVQMAAAAAIAGRVTTQERPVGPGLEGREEELAVQMAAAAAIAGRVSTLDQSFLVALEFMIGQADANNDSKGRWLQNQWVPGSLVAGGGERATLITAATENASPGKTRGAVLQVPFPPPPKVQVVSLLVATSDKNRRRDIITRALAGGGKLPAEASPGGNMGGIGGMEPPEVHVPGARLEEIISQADDLVAVSVMGTVWGKGDSKGMEPPEVHVPGGRLEEIIAQADDLVAVINGGATPHSGLPAAGSAAAGKGGGTIAHGGGHSVQYLPLPSIHHTLSSIHHTLPSIHHTLPSIHHTLPSIHHTLPSIHHTLPSIHHTLPSIHHTLPSIHHTLPSIHHTLSSIHHTLSSIHHTLPSIHHTLSSIHHTLSSIHHTLSSIHHTLSSIHHALPSTPHPPQSMEEQLPIQDRRLLARLLLAREEARSLMSGGIQDPRNDVRRLKNVPEAEVRLISTLVAMKSPDMLRKRILDVMEGREEGEYKKGSDGPIKVQQSKGSAPVRPGHLLDTVTKVLGGMYRTGGSGVTVQQLEW